MVNIWITIRSMIEKESLSSDAEHKISTMAIFGTNFTL